MEKGREFVERLSALLSKVLGVVAAPLPSRGGRLKRFPGLKAGSLEIRTTASRVPRFSTLLEVAESSRQDETMIPVGIAKADGEEAEDSIVIMSLSAFLAILKKGA